MSYATAEFTTPMGKMLAAIDEQGALVRLDFLVGRTGEEIRRQIGDGSESEAQDPEACRPVIEQLQAYFRGERRRFELELAPEGTEFEHRVWTDLRRIPFGSTDTYGEIARRLGDPDAARAVGVANARNPIAIVVPCHRVIGSDGDLTGYAGGLERKKWLLDMESGQARLEFYSA